MDPECFPDGSWAKSRLFLFCLGCSMFVQIGAMSGLGLVLVGCNSWCNSSPSLSVSCLHPGQRQMLDDIGIGQALFLLTGLPPFLRVKELRAKDRGELPLGWMCLATAGWLRGGKLDCYHFTPQFGVIAGMLEWTTSWGPMALSIELPVHPQEKQAGRGQGEVWGQEQRPKKVCWSSLWLLQPGPLARWVQVGWLTCHAGPPLIH
jgi:hypothetical protein